MFLMISIVLIVLDSLRSTSKAAVDAEGWAGESMLEVPAVEELEQS